MSRARHNQPQSFSRADRVAEQIRRDLSELIRTELKDPRVKLVSLTDVELTPDFAHAKIFFTSLQQDDKRAEVEAGLRAAAGFLRRELGRDLRIHTLPQLHFVYDESMQRGNHLSQLIDQAVGQAPAADDADESKSS